VRKSAHFCRKADQGFHLYRREPCYQLSFADFFLPFGGKLSRDNRWIKLAELIPWDELEDDDAAQFRKGFGAPAKPFRMALGALIIKACLGLTDEELIEQIKENPSLQFYIGLAAFQYSAWFDPSMMVYFHKRFSEAVVNDCNERIVLQGLKAIGSSASQDPDDNSGGGGGSASGGDQPMPSPQAQPNQGSLIIDASCAPVDIRHPTDRSLLNEAREVTESMIDAMHPQIRDVFGHKPRTHCRKVRRPSFWLLRKRRSPGSA
jgi:hypothetical protein